MFILKSCPHCGGDLHLNAEDEMVCIQCGYELRPEQAARLIDRVASLQAARLQTAGAPAGLSRRAG